MGILLLLFMLAGVAAGLLVTVPLLLAAGLLARGLAKGRAHVWPVALVAGTLFTTLAIVVVNAGALPLADVRPGNDYDKAALNLFMVSTAYVASVGVGYLLGATCGFACPRGAVEIE